MTWGKFLKLIASQCPHMRNGSNNLFFFLIFIEEYLIYNVVTVSVAQQSDSVIHVHISILFQTNDLST